MTVCGECDDEIDSIWKAIDIAFKLEKDDAFVYDNWEFHKFPFGLWFRGQPKFGKKLEPPVYRKIKTKEEKYHDETNLYEHLRGRAPGYRDRYASAFDWLCLMQHYSLPTRLLDWSESILPALYFAVSKKEDFDGENGELIILNARRLNGFQKTRPTIYTPKHPEVIVRAEMAGTRSLKTLRDVNQVKEALAILEPKTMKHFSRPIAVFPYRLNERMVFQSSVFTLHGGKVYPAGMRKRYEGQEKMPKPVSLEKINSDSGYRILRRYRIPSEKKQKIRRGLFVLGIHEGTLFPEIDRQAVYLKELW